MPLPDSKTDWPLPHWKNEQRNIDEARLWLIGDTDALGSFYDNTASTPQSWRRKLSAAARRTNTNSTRPSRLHVPLARRIARTSAALLFSDPPTLSIPDAHLDTPLADAQATEAIIHQHAKTDGWSAKLLQAAYVASGTGGVYLRPTWDQTLYPDRPTLSIIHHDHAIPTFALGKLVSVIFWAEVERDGSGNVWRHLELHTAGQVEHALYAGNQTGLGERKGLADHARTAGFRQPDGSGVINLRPLGIEGLLPDYIPNQLPNPKTLSGDLGGSDTAGLEGSMDAIDEADTSWDRDVRLSKARLVVPDEFLDHAGRGSGATFDQDRDIFSPLSMDPSQRDKAGIELVQPEVRAEQFDATIRSRSDRLSIDAGYSPASVEWANTGAAQTATEVLSRDALSADTTSAKRQYWAPAIESMTYKTQLIMRSVYKSPVVPMRPTVVWPSAAEQDMREVASTLNLLNLSGAVSIERKVSILNPTWSTTQIAEEVARIQLETGTAVADPTGGFPA